MPSTARKASRLAERIRSGDSKISSSFRRRTGPMVGSILSAMQASVGVMGKKRTTKKTLRRGRTEHPTRNIECKVPQGAGQLECADFYPLPSTLDVRRWAFGVFLSERPARISEGNLVVVRFGGSRTLRWRSRSAGTRRAAAF